MGESADIGDKLIPISTGCGRIFHMPFMWTGIDFWMTNG